MRLIEVLPDYEAKRFSRPPVLTSDDRKKYFKIDDSIRELVKRQLSLPVGDNYDCRFPRSKLLALTSLI